LQVLKAVRVAYKRRYTRVSWGEFAEVEEQQSGLSEHSPPAHESTRDILRSVLKGTEEQNKRAYDVLVSLADEGFLDQHQTGSALNTVAKRLLDTLYGDDT